jgi:hypothetical protein
MYPSLLFRIQGELLRAVGAVGRAQWHDYERTRSDMRRASTTRPRCRKQRGDIRCSKLQEEECGQGIHLAARVSMTGSAILRLRHSTSRGTMIALQQHEHQTTNARTILPVRCVFYTTSPPTARSKPLPTNPRSPPSPCVPPLSEPSSTQPHAHSKSLAD